MKGIFYSLNFMWTLSQKQDLPVFRQIPFAVIHQQFKFVDMITDVIKESIFYLALISNSLVSRVANVITNFSCFDHFLDQVTCRVDMLRYFFKYLFLIGKR